jgi:hypothetical protein
VISFWVGGDLLMTLLTMAGVAQGGGVAFAAHVGGFLWGVGAVSLYKFCQRQEKPSEPASAPIRVTVPAQALGQVPSIYLLLDHAQAGPFTLGQVHAMLALGSAPADTLYWQDGMSEWRSAAELEEPAAR